MADSTTKRLDRIEEKLDKMGEVLIALARFEEKMDAYNDYREKSWERMNKFSSKLDDIGYSSIESWGGAIFDSCVRYLDEDPWERLREFKRAMPKTKQQMLLRGQNLVGYKHYSDEIVSKFIDIS